MALDGKAIKEEVLDKDVYAVGVLRVKGKIWNLPLLNWEYSISY